MSDGKALCNFCGYEKKLTSLEGLCLCAKCASRYAQMCLNYREHVSAQLAPKGWKVQLATSTLKDTPFSEGQQPLFYICCEKNSVSVITAVDKVGFFAAASRLQVDLMSPKRQRPNVKKVSHKGKGTH